jgi:hypothetical protein
MTTASGPHSASLIATRSSAAVGFAVDMAAHLAMLAIMVAAMWPGAGSATRLAAAAALVVLAIAVAPSSRRSPRLRILLLDLWAMILLLVLHPSGVSSAAGHHASPLGSESALVVVVALVWVISRLVVTRDRHAAVTGIVTALQIAVMLAMSVR